MKNAYYIGNLRDESLIKNKGGWIIGHFMDGKLNTKNLEVKYWEFRRGDDVKHGVKVLDGVTEWTYILKGRTIAIIDKKKIELKAGDFILIHPSTPNNLVSIILDDTQGITVKSPSVKGSKRLLE